MAVNSGDFASGFRHSDIIKFINNEVLMNGGGPDFYTTFCSRPWNEIEDWLRAVLADPQVPHNLKKAYTWSAVTLSVHVGARQHEQQLAQVQWLQKQVEEREAASWALASQIRQLREERDKVASNLQFALCALRQTMNERDVLRQRLLQAELSAQGNQLPQAVGPVQGDQQHGAISWPMNAEGQGKMEATGVHSMPHLETQMAALGTELHMQGPPSAWDQAMQLPLPMPAPHPFPVHAPFPIGFPYSTHVPPPPGIMEAEGTVAGTVTAVTGAVVPQKPRRVYPPGLCATVGAQKDMASLSDQSNYRQCKYPENPQLGCYPGESTNQSQDEGLLYPQKEYPVMSQEKYSLGKSKGHSQEEGPVMPQEKYPWGNKKSHCQEEGSMMPQGKYPLKDSKSQDESPVMPQEDYPLGKSKSHSQEKGPESSQRMFPLGSSRNGDVRKSLKQEPQGQRAKQSKGITASESQYQEMPASHYSPHNWNCPRCKAINFSWRKSCYKCKRVCMAVESGGLDPGQTHLGKVTVLKKGSA